jgi:hypothetical protein
MKTPPPSPPPSRNGAVLAGLIALVPLVFLALFFYWFFRGGLADSTATQLWDVADTLSVLLCIGLITGVTGMAVTQFAKNMYPLRGGFHRQYLAARFGASWPDLQAMLVTSHRAVSGVRGQVRKANSQAKMLNPESYRDPAREFELRDFRGPKEYAEYLRSLEKMASTDTPPLGTDVELMRPHVDRLLDASAEHVMAQVSQVSQFVMVRPRNHVGLLREFAGPSGSDAVTAYALAVMLQEDENLSDAAANLAFDVRHYVEQSLNTLLLNMRSTWRARVRRGAALVAAIVGLVALVFVNVHPVVKVSTIVASGVIGGSVAWLARDVVAVVEKWRG